MARHRRKLGLLVLLCALGHVACSTRSPRVSPGLPGVLVARVELADWGLSRPDEIGYVSLGVMRRAGQDELLIYDVRRAPPSKALPARVAAAAPSLEGGRFLIDAFAAGGPNRLGGYFSAYRRAPSSGQVRLATLSGGERALSFSYHRGAQGYTGFWIHLFATRARPQDRVFLDAREIPFLTFAIRGARGGERLLLKVADEAWERKEDALPLAEVSAYLPAGRVTRDWQRASVPLDRLPGRLRRGELASLVFDVPSPQTGQVYLRGLALTSAREVELPPPSAPPRVARRLRRALWVWETARIAADPAATQNLVDHCRAERVSDVFLQIPYRARHEGERWLIDWDPARLASLVERLHQIGARVEALDGDPHLAEAAQHGRILATVRELVAYNRRAPRLQRFDGVRYDNEFYLVRGFVRSRSRELRAYLALLREVRQLAARGGLSLGADIPFWFDSRNAFQELGAELDGRPVSEHLIDILDDLSIMDYRTEAYGPDGVVAHALDELTYAARRGKSVLIGLETVDLPDETQQEFASGSGVDPVLISLAKPGSIDVAWFVGPAGERARAEMRAAGSFLALGRVKSIEVPSSKLTFARLGRAALRQVMDQAELELSPLPSFGGFALHSYESYRWLR